MSEQQNDPRRGWTSASNAQYDALCPGRHQAQRGIPEPVKTKAAETGNRLHAALLKHDPTGLDPEERERYEAACVLETKLVADFFGPDTPKLKCFRQQRFWVKIQNAINGEAAPVLEHSGEPDVVYRYDTRALILDYKGLYGDIPPASNNLQLRDYAVLVKGHFLTVDAVGVAIIQPAVNHSPEICVYDKEALAAAELAMFQRVVASNTPTAPRHAGAVQCHFCKAKTECAEYQKYAGSMVPGMVGILEVPASAWTPQQRSHFLRARKVALDWMETNYDLIAKILEKDPDGAPGFYLKPGAKREAINDPQRVFERFLALGGKPEQFMPCVNVTKGRLKERVAVVTGATGKKLAAAMDVLLDGVVTPYQCDPSIAEVEDSKA